MVRLEVTMVEVRRCRLSRDTKIYAVRRHEDLRTDGLLVGIPSCTSLGSGSGVGLTEETVEVP